LAVRFGGRHRAGFKTEQWHVSAYVTTRSITGKQ